MSFKRPPVGKLANNQTNCQPDLRNVNLYGHNNLRVKFYPNNGNFTPDLRNTDLSLTFRIFGRVASEQEGIYFHFLDFGFLE